MDRTTRDSRRDFLEPYGGTLVANNRLLIALTCVSIVLVGFLALMGWVFTWAKDQKPLIVRIDEVGRATPLSYSSFDYRPEDRELRYFLAQFVYLHFGRMRSTVEANYSKSLYFVDKQLSHALVEEERQKLSIANFLKEGGDEVDIGVSNIALQDLRTRPMKATVDFEKIYLSRDHREIKREQYAGYFEFVVQETVPNWMVLVNPLGLTVTYFRTDAAFKQ